tara:strand:- start:348 stop:1358 length:1011 start_codon:yes stop_codon:yes gene_type:complete
MKLFQRLLVAPAALGLMSPVAVNADHAFKSTTTINGSAVFTTGAVDGGLSPSSGQKKDNLYNQYAYGIESNTSFTGEDSLYIGAEAGNASGPMSPMDSAVSGGNDLNVHSAFYTFPIGSFSVTAGPLVDQDDVVGATLSPYSDSFYLGALPYSLAGGETGPGVGITYSNDFGFVASASFVADDGDSSSKGINTDTGNDVTTFTIGYDGDGFGGGLIVASNDGDVGTAGYDTFGGGIYWSPDSIPATVSVSIDSKDPETGKDEDDWMVGIDYELGDGILSMAYSFDDTSALADGAEWEASYAYALNDSVTLTPGVFGVEETDTDDDFGTVLEVSFAF